MRDIILAYMKDLVSIKSVSDTKEEALAAKYIVDILRGQEYFEKNPQYMGEFVLENDHLHRTVPYGLIKGNSAKTVIFTGHYDVVGIEEYGSYQELAFDIDQLTEALKQDQSLDEDTKRDLESGEWLCGRGTADMKGSLAALLAVIDQYGRATMAHSGPSFCNVLFLAVPDEESYSHGIKGAVSLLDQLRQEYHLHYECCIDLEPNSRIGKTQQMFLGSVGKCMPIAVVQGAKAHVGECFKGINAIGILAQFFLETELSPEFTEQYEGDVCMPPTWLSLRDMKEEYDVSLPLRAAGYMNLLSYESTPESIISKLKTIGEQVFYWYEKRMDILERSIIGEEQEGSLRPAGRVMDFSELIRICQKKEGEVFDRHYHEICLKIKKKLLDGDYSVPGAAVQVMTEVLDLSGISEPVMILGFAPIYYPAYHSDQLDGKEGAGSKIFSIMKEAAQIYKVKLEKHHYFGGISDLSFCGISKKFDAAKYSTNTPLWQYGYDLDIDKIYQLNIPSVLFGPWGKDIHKKTERINIPSLTEEVPHVLWQLLVHMSKE